MISLLNLAEGEDRYFFLIRTTEFVYPKGISAIKLIVVENNVTSLPTRKGVVHFRAACPLRNELEECKLCKDRYFSKM